MRKRTAQQIEEHKSVTAPKAKANKSLKAVKAKPPSRRGQNPNSRKNLSPWPKGTSGNPGGLPGTDVAAIIARRAFEEHPEEILVGFQEQLSKGNAYAFSVLADRGYGKLKEKIEHSGLGSLAEKITAGRARIANRKNA